MSFAESRMIDMKIARILYPVHVLGPGERVAIWTYGCNHKCPGCANPELWQGEGKAEIDSHKLKEMLAGIQEKGRIDGITITGGDPFYDSKGLSELLGIANEYTEDILLYTGYLIEELETDCVCKENMKKVAVLIDGTYREAKNQGHVLKGSENQRIFYLKEKYQERYEQYIEENQGKYLVENFPARDGVIFVGIHKPDFDEKILQYSSRRGKNYEQ